MSVSLVTYHENLEIILNLYATARTKSALFISSSVQIVSSQDIIFASSKILYYTDEHLRGIHVPVMKRF